MEKDVWKWLFSEMSEGTLVQLIRGINKTLNPRSQIVVKGASDLSKIRPEQLRLYRGRIETEINKPKNIIRARNYLQESIENSHTDKKNIMQSLSEKQTNEIWSEIESDDNLSFTEMICYLIVQIDKEKNEKGIDLHKRLVETFKDNSLNSLVDKSYSETSNSSNSLNHEDEIKQEIARLKDENHKLQEERKESIKTIKELKKIVEQTENNNKGINKLVQKLSKELEFRKNELATRDRKTQEVQQKIIKFQQIEAGLKKENELLITQLEQAVQKNQILEEELRKVKQVISEPKRHVTIIDRSLPDGLDQLNSTEFKLVTPNKLEEMPTKNLLEKSDEIWFIKFRLSIPKQSFLSETYGNKVVGFGNYNDLKDYCNLL